MTESTCTLKPAVRVCGAGVRTHFVGVRGEAGLEVRACDMLPIEWVTRRVATGSYLKRHHGVGEGHRFSPPKLETFLKVGQSVTVPLCARRFFALSDVRKCFAFGLSTQSEFWRRRWQFFYFFGGIFRCLIFVRRLCDQQNLRNNLRRFLYIGSLQDVSINYSFPPF